MQNCFGIEESTINLTHSVLAQCQVANVGKRVKYNSMAFLKFNKSELVNLSYSLNKEILCANKTGGYCNTSIATCNTRRYHGLLAVTLDRFGGDKYLLLSDLDESLVIDGKKFNLGIHCYGDVYEPRGHKYIVDFSADPIPQITYKVGNIVFRKSIVLAPDKDQVLLKFELIEAPKAISLQLRPFLAFRNIHALTQQNNDADTSGREIVNGVSYRLYSAFPDLNMQLSDSKSTFSADPHWYNNVTYSDEYRRGFDCREDLVVPGHFEAKLKPGDSLVFSASTAVEDPKTFKRRFNSYFAKSGSVSSYRDVLLRNADQLIVDHNNRKKINAGLTWMYTGLLRETLWALPGLTLYGFRSPTLFEEILDNLIADERERLYSRTTQIEAPLCLSIVLQKYIDDFKADPEAVWKKYGPVMRGVLQSYLPGVRKEVSMTDAGLLWTRNDGVALSWMNAYINGRAVTERGGLQVGLNAFWYNAICFALEMEQKYPSMEKDEFVARWSEIRDKVLASYQSTFWNERAGILEDYVDEEGQHLDMRPNQLFAVWVKYSPVEELLHARIFRAINRELVTSRGIRTLSPRDSRYKGVYQGTQHERDLAYHQGSTRPFLLEPFIEVGFRINGPSYYKRAQWLIEGFYEDLSKHGVGAFSELYDGDPPHEPHGAISSALSTAALLEIDYRMNLYKED